MGEQENMFQCQLFYGKEQVGLEPHTDVLIQSEHPQSKWENSTCQEMTISVGISEGDKRYIRKLMRKAMPRLPRKLKKYVKKHYFFGYTKVVSRWELLMAFALNRPEKTAWKKHWTIGFVKN